MSFEFEVVSDEGSFLARRQNGDDTGTSGVLEERQETGKEEYSRVESESEDGVKTF